MANDFAHITPAQAELIRNAPLFFIASADPSLAAPENGLGPVNLSPKGDSKLVVIDPNTVAYLDYTGSGNETARHAAAGGPVTVMLCSFEAVNAAIVRLYGAAQVLSLDEYAHREMLEEGAAGEIALPERQVIEIAVASTVTSCGYGVPVITGFTPRTRRQRGRRYKAVR